MNLILPYGSNIMKNIIALDDQSLSNQIIDCYNILKFYIHNYNGNYRQIKDKVIFHYVKHNALNFVSDYGQIALLEYHYRMGKYHKYNDWFVDLQRNLNQLLKNTPQISRDKIKLIYAQEIQLNNVIGIDYIIKTKNVEELYKTYLINRWEENIREHARVPEWTKREIPEFFPLPTNISSKKVKK